MNEFVIFFLILLISVFLSALFSKLHLPWVISLIVGGLLLGPSGLDIVVVDDTLRFFSEIGLVFLMFMVGLETKLSGFKKAGAGPYIMTIVNGLLPAIAGVFIGRVFGYNWTESLLLGIIFISTSIAVVVPVLESKKILKTRLGRTIIGGTMLKDISSLLLLSIFLQVTVFSNSVPLPVMYAGLLVTLILFRLGGPGLKRMLGTRIRAFHKKKQQDLFQQELRLIVTLLLGIVVLFHMFGLHPIVAGFFAGLVLSEIVESEITFSKLRAISYGLFIPVFFVVIGLETDLTVFKTAGAILPLVLTVVIGSMVMQFSSGWLAGVINGFSMPESVFMGVAALPQLSTTIAVASTGRDLGLLSPEVVVAMIILSIVTTLVGPLLIYVLAPKLAKPSLVERIAKV